MIKYTERQKLDAVAAYEKGTAGLKATAEAHGLGIDSLRKWVELFRARGLSGIQRKRRCSFDAEFKLEVIRRMEDEGLSSRQTAVLFGLRRFDQVAEWRRLYVDHGVTARCCPCDSRGNAAEPMHARMTTKVEADLVI